MVSVILRATILLPNVPVARGSAKVIQGRVLRLIQTFLAPSLSQRLALAPQALNLKALSPDGLVACSIQFSVSCRGVWNCICM